jgi:hypothetical protein
MRLALILPVVAVAVLVAMWVTVLAAVVLVAGLAVT